MSIGFATPTATALMTALRDSIDAGSAAAYALLYSGARPINGGAPEADSLIATIEFAYPCGTINGSGALVIAQGPNGAVDQAGTPTWARVYDANDTRVCDFSARLAGTTPDPDDPEELVIDAPEIQAGAYIRILSGTIGV